ncbi:MAG: thiamine pyrophosphate-dependent enzyme [Armatimonadetes bacterium]|nr:thiamine pyrophosphate-dependent enzyme [Armatimonadota bacterium]MDW8152704.1 thiamine pyrophosphate-dependent enzyme [Armatimonadota bacterium]
MPREAVADTHPLDEVLRSDRLPHIWCPGCGLGTVLGCFARAMVASGIPLDRHVVVSGIGCTGRAAGYLNVDGFHTRNMDLNVICVNNFNYGMTGGQLGPTTPQGAITTTSPYGFPEEPFNLPRLLTACGAVFVARWTCLHVRQLEATMVRALRKRGFRFIEVLAPCPVGFGRPNDLGEGIDELWFYRRQADYDPQAALERLEIRMRKDSKIVWGVFVDTERPTYMDRYREYVLRKVQEGPGAA